MYERPAEPRISSEDAGSFLQQDARSYMQQDARSYMEQDAQGRMEQDARSNMEPGYIQQDNRAVYEDDNDVAEVEVHYQNDWDRNLHAECSSNVAIFKFQSVHDNRREDRLWRFDCKKVHRLFLVLCAVNLKEIPLRLSLMVHLPAGGIMESDLPMTFMYPANYYMAGVRSKHDNKREDRV